jgi:predicted PurR-regulated permease PerM
MPDGVFIRRSLILMGLIAAALVVWWLRHVELLVFASVLLAILLTAAAARLRKLLRAPPPWDLLLTLALTVIALAGLFTFFAVSFEGQLSDLLRRAPAALNGLQIELSTTPLGKPLVDSLRSGRPEFAGQMLGQARAYVTSFGQGLLELVLVLVGGVYFAAQPTRYRSGLLRLAPDGVQGELRRFLLGSHLFLKRWMIAQLVSMVFVGVMAGVGLAILGAPAFAALGVIAALAEFIPLLGPFLAAAPALLIAASKSWVLAAETAALYVGIHLVEANLLQPWLQRRFASIPPVVSIFALVVFGALFGVLGVILAAPLAIVTLVSVRVLYLEEEVTLR